jgi:putative transposase
MKKEHVKLSDADRTFLENLLKKGNLSAKKYKRATALLELNRGRTFTSVAETVGLTKQTTSTLAQKYRAEGLQCLDDKKRPGRPKTIDGVNRAKITALACSEPPQGYDSWSLRLLADKVVELEYVESVSHTEIGRILKKTNLNRT